MTQGNTLKRLLRLRQLQEEQSRMALEDHVSERKQLERELMLATNGWIQAKRDFVSAAEEDNRIKRAGGLMEAEAAIRRQSSLRSEVAATNLEISNGLEELLRRRLSRKQVETLVEVARQQDMVQIARGVQETLDDSYGRGKRNSIKLKKGRSGVVA